jgi:type II secretion system protein D
MHLEEAFLRSKILFFIAAFLLTVFSITSSVFPQETAREPEVPTGVTEKIPAPSGEQTPAESEKQVVPSPQPFKAIIPEAKPQETEEQAEPAPPVTIQQEKAPVPPPKQVKQAAPPTVSFFFDDADIFEVAQTIFADVLKVNYLIDPQVKGRVNFRTVTPIPKDQVLPVMEIIFRLNGIGFVEEGGLYRIVPLTEVPKELVYSQIGKTPDKVAMEMFAFKNVELKESMPDIENALGLQLKGGTVRIIPFFRMNALLVVASSKEQLEYIKQWVATFDNMFAVAKPKIYVYPLQNSKATHIASLLQSIFTGSESTTSSTTPKKTEPAKTAGKTTTPAPAASAPQTGAAATVTGGGTFVSANTRIFADEITNTLIILASPTDYSFIEETIKKIDIMPRQVVIEGLIASVKLTDNYSLGFAWSVKSDINITGIDPFNDVKLNGDFYSLPGGAALNPGGSGGFTFVGTDPTGHVRARITAAMMDERVKVLASPHILVSDNREARIQVGQQVPLATQTSTGIETTTTVTSTVQYKDIGIILTVKPQINDSGLIALEITQEISQLGGAAFIADQQFSSIDKIEATTNLVAQDGETIIIGGLIREDNTKHTDGIPILSKIPLIGHLFSSKSDNTTRTELIILLTPHVMRNLKEAGNVTTGYVERYKGTSKDAAVDDFIKEKTP